MLVVSPSFTLHKERRLFWREINDKTNTKRSIFCVSMRQYFSFSSGHVRLYRLWLFASPTCWFVVYFVCRGLQQDSITCPLLLHLNYSSPFSHLSCAAHLPNRHIVSCVLRVAVTLRFKPTLYLITNKLGKLTQLLLLTIPFSMSLSIVEWTMNSWIHKRPTHMFRYSESRKITCIFLNFNSS